MFCGGRRGPVSSMSVRQASCGMAPSCMTGGTTDGQTPKRGTQHKAPLPATEFHSFLPLVSSSKHLVPFVALEPFLVADMVYRVPLACLSNGFPANVVVSGRPGNFTGIGGYNCSYHYYHYHH